MAYIQKILKYLLPKNEKRHKDVSVIGDIFEISKFVVIDDKTDQEIEVNLKFDFHPKQLKLTQKHVDVIAKKLNGRIRGKLAATRIFREIIVKYFEPKALTTSLQQDLSFITDVYNTSFVQAVQKLDKNIQECDRIRLATHMETTFDAPTFPGIDDLIHGFSSQGYIK